MRLAATGTLPVALSAVLLTHLHSDHITDLNDIVTTHWIMTTEPTSLAIIGPPGTAAVAEAVLDLLAFDLRYRMAHHADLSHAPQLDVTEVTPGQIVEVGTARVTVYETDHRPVAPTVGYRVEHDGAVAAIAGDTVPCAGLDDLCRGADIYVQTTIRDDLIRPAASGRLRDILDYHSTVEQAAQTASRAGVKTLMLTHYVPPPAPGDEEAWRELAAAHFAGEIVLGNDLTTAVVGR
jgi:ribonuclease Z